MSSDSPTPVGGNTIDSRSSQYAFGHVKYHGKSSKEQQDNTSESDINGCEQQMPAFKDQNPDSTFSLFGDSYQSSPTSPISSISRKRLDIWNHDGTLNLHELLQSGTRIPLHLPPILIIPLLTRANICHARILILEKQINRLEDGSRKSSLAMQTHENDRDRERKALREKKEAFMCQMLANAHEAIDLAGLLRAPDLQARGYWYLAIAAKEEGNEHLWESYLEKCLEARESLEGRAAAGELGIHENEDT